MRHYVSDPKITGISGPGKSTKALHFPVVSLFKMGLPDTGNLVYTKDMNTQRLNRRQCAEAISQRLTFSNSTGSLKGHRKTDTCDPGQHLTGMLNAEERKRFLSDAHYGIDYLVVSYDTPIAWITSDGTKYRVSQKFSQTTSCHMGLTWLPDSAKVEA